MRIWGFLLSACAVAPKGLQSRHVLHHHPKGCHAYVVIGVLWLDHKVLPI